MITKHKRFTPESIQQLKEANRYLHSRSDQAAAGDGYKAAIESNLIELSNRVDNIRYHRDAFIDQLNADLEALEDLLHDSLVAYAALTELQNNE
jgi:hypothetical protein